MTALSTEIVTDTRRLDELTEPWRALWHACPTPTPFQSPAWLLSWWHTFQPGMLTTIAVWRGTALTAIAPLYIEATPEERRLLPIGIGPTDYLDLLVEPDCKTPALCAVASAVASLDWETWHWPDVPPDGSALSLPPPHATGATITDGAKCPVLSLTDQPSIPPAKRRKLRMSRHRCARLGSSRIVETASLDPESWLGHLRALHQSRWLTQGEPGVISEAMVAFLARALPALMAENTARLYLLEIADRPAACYVGLRDRKNAYAYLGGFDPAFAYASPGSLLLAHAIEAASGEGASAFHFLRGEEPYKYAWGATDRRSRNITVIRRSA